MSINQKIDICYYLNDPIKIRLHEHPLILCLTPERKNFGSDWSCNSCKIIYNYNSPSFYCTFCDFDLCTKCLGFCQLNQISIYKDDNKFTTNNINNNNTSFQWQKRIHKHEHFLTLIEKLNKNYNWKCEFCLKEYSNNNVVYYCSICDFHICQTCLDNINNNHFSNLQILNNSNNDYDHFQIKSFRFLNKLNKNKNLLYSPLALEIILNILTNCIVHGNASNEINREVYYDLDYYNYSLGQLSLKIGNIFYSNKFIWSNYLEKIKKTYSTIFANNISQLNNFISEKTNNKVISYFNNNDIEESDFILANVLYFSCLWKIKFETCCNLMPFYLSNGNITNINMMKSKYNFKYYNDDSIQAIEIPYEQKNICAMVLLPNKNISLDDLIDNLTQDRLNILCDELKFKEVELIMPKFKFNNQNERLDLKEMLKNIGIKQIFENFEFEFDRLYQIEKHLTKNQYCRINKVFQTNLINVDENGTELINICSMGGTFGSSASKTIFMKVDRPFLFLIRYIKERNKIFQIGHDLIFISKIENI